MEKPLGAFDEHTVLHRLKHLLPSQAPLKDFIHHNTLHAFQHLPFHEGLKKAAETFGYRVYPGLRDYRTDFASGRISREALDGAIRKNQPGADLGLWRDKLLQGETDESMIAETGQLRKAWKRGLAFNPDKVVHPLLFRTMSNYLDQGIAIWPFPGQDRGFLSALRALERQTAVSLFRTKRVRKILLHTHCKIEDLLADLAGDERLYEQYLTDQQFAHPGWSGMVSTLEDQPEGLTDKRKTTLHDLVVFELLLELDTLDFKFGEGKWKPAGDFYTGKAKPPDRNEELFAQYAIWQDALEHSYYDRVLKGLLTVAPAKKQEGPKPFQAIFCIDDRNCSIRRYLEDGAPGSETFGTAGFFNVAFFFKPEHGKHLTKVCPAPMTPGFIVKETEAGIRHKRDLHFNARSFGLVGGWLISQTMGFRAAGKLAMSILRPSETPATVSSFKHMDPRGKLSLETDPVHPVLHDLQLGFTVPQMAERIEELLRSIGLTEGFAPLVYIIGHGASSVNNTHYAGYDCGACSGRPGSVNARIAAQMANRQDVRKLLAERGIEIPESTRFLGALHDTTRDEIQFFDAELLSSELVARHETSESVFQQALSLNAKERSRRFLMMDTSETAEEIHRKVKLRALSLFEPRPEWNHATNALAIVGKRATNKGLFLDRRAFLNSYDAASDPEGKWLTGILRAVAPVCGGINLEYYFSKTDNARLGAGSKLPHNVMGLIGVANGMDGDLRPGLPLQMINIHEPLRLLVIVEQTPEIILKVLNQEAATRAWFDKEWIHLVAKHPERPAMFRYENGEFRPFEPQAPAPETADNLTKIFETQSGHLPVYLLN